jgi:hypothetical protein
MRRSFVAVALVLFAGASIAQAQGTTAAPPAPQTPAAQPAPAADPLKFSGAEEVLLVIQVKPGKSADFEAGFADMTKALAASTKPELVAHGATMKLNKVAMAGAGADAPSLYVLQINKPTADLSYNFGLILFYAGKPQGAAYEGPLAKQEDALAIYNKIQENIASINPWPLTKIG